MKNNFTPENYEIPKGKSNYLKLEKGVNKFRILSKPIVGFLDWKDKTPLRFPMNARPLNSIDPKKPIKHFWAMLVWDYNTMEIKILELTQKSLQEAIQKLAKDEDWGSPFDYDIKITREGDGMETKYSLNPSPHKSVTEDILKAFEDKPCCLDLLFLGEDPFKATTDITPLNR